jgi:hypothetical protein
MTSERATHTRIVLCSDEEREQVAILTPRERALAMIEYARIHTQEFAQRRKIGGRWTIRGEWVQRQEGAGAGGSDGE